MDSNLVGAFAEWVDSAVQVSPPPREIVAFNFNLYEGPFRADLIGATAYDPLDSDWATDEAWVAAPRLFDLPASAWGSGWEDALGFVADLVRVYLAAEGVGARRLRSAQAVTAGFVDGDLVVISKGVH